MHITLDSSAFVNAFADYGRGSNFSREARELMFDYFEDIDPDMELDVIAVCCDYAESEAADIARDNRIDLDDDLTEEERTEAVEEWLNERTAVIGTTRHGIVYCTSF